MYDFERSFGERGGGRCYEALGFDNASVRVVAGVSKGNKDGNIVIYLSSNKKPERFLVKVDLRSKLSHGTLPGDGETLWGCHKEVVS